MKKVLLALSLMLVTSVGMALDTLKSGDEMVKRLESEKKVVGLIFTHEKDKRSENILNVTKEYEKRDTDVVFLLAPLENQELAMVAMSLGVVELPTTIFIKDGMLIAGVAGNPPSADAVANVVTQVKEMAKQLPPAAPAQEPKQEGTKATPFKSGTAVKIKSLKF